MQSSFSFAWKRNYSARINSHCLEWYEAHIHTSIVYKQIALWFVEFMPSTELPIFRCPCAPRNMKLRCAIKIRQWTCNNNKIYVHIKAFRTNEKQVYRKKNVFKNIRNILIWKIILEILSNSLFFVYFLRQSGSHSESHSLACIPLHLCDWYSHQSTSCAQCSKCGIGNKLTETQHTHTHTIYSWIIYQHSTARRAQKYTLCALHVPLRCVLCVFVVFFYFLYCGN